MIVPRLETERLLLREWRPGDIEWHVALSADAEVRRYIGGTMNRIDAWRQFAGMIGHWYLRGHGFWLAERKSDGARLGGVGVLRHETWPGIEVGWNLERRYWGSGYATEGARAAQDWAFANLSVEAVISCIDPANIASQKVAQRLGNAKGRALTMTMAGETFTVDVWEKTRAAWQAERRPAPKVVGEHKLAPMPRLETERLVLREWRQDDIAPHVAMMGDAMVTRYTNGEPQSVIDAWRGLCTIVGQWYVRGYGFWAVERKSDGKFLGRVGLWHPEGWPGMEVGWTLAREAWGRGYAAEAAQASMDYAFNAFDIPKILSVIRIDNAPSQAVARRLGERRAAPVTIEHSGKSFSCETWEISRAEWEARRT